MLVVVMQSVTLFDMLSVIVLTVVIPHIVVLSVVAPFPWLLGWLKQK
jgi:hypothetical protein